MTEEKANPFLEAAKAYANLMHARLIRIQEMLHKFHNFGIEKQKGSWTLHDHLSNVTTEMKRIAGTVSSLNAFAYRISTQISGIELVDKEIKELTLKNLNELEKIRYIAPGQKHFFQLVLTASEKELKEIRDIIINIDHVHIDFQKAMRAAKEAKINIEEKLTALKEQMADITSKGFSAPEFETALKPGNLINAIIKELRSAQQEFYRMSENILKAKGRFEELERYEKAQYAMLVKHLEFKSPQLDTTTICHKYAQNVAALANR